MASRAALILVAFGGSSFLKDYAVNAIRYVLAVAFKLLRHATRPGHRHRFH